MADKILFVNGPNLNMLGIREPEKYGNRGLEQITSDARALALELGYQLASFQSNSEGEIVDYIQREGLEAKGMVLNAAAYTHTSVAIRDAILSASIPFVEVHLSNIYKREDFRHKSYLTDIAIGIISGFGEGSYYLGIRGLIDFIEKKA